jgi:hypothetical protein
MIALANPGFWIALTHDTTVAAARDSSTSEDERSIRVLASNRFLAAGGSPMEARAPGGIDSGL